MDLDDTTYIIDIDDVEVLGEGEGERREGGERGRGGVTFWLTSSYFTLITSPAAKAILRWARGAWPALPALRVHVSLLSASQDRAFCERLSEARWRPIAASWRPQAHNRQIAQTAWYPVSIKGLTVSTKNPERIDGSWSNLYIGRSKTKHLDQTHNFHDKMCICVKQRRLTYLRGVNVLAFIKDYLIKKALQTVVLFIQTKERLNLTCIYIFVYIFAWLPYNKGISSKISKNICKSPWNIN